jgi:error-prone DNA polymerase
MSSNEVPRFAALDPFAAVREDYQAFGASVQAHPMAALRKVRTLPAMTTYVAKRQPPKTRVCTAGLLLVRQRPPTANGVCFAAIEDEHGFLDLVFFPKDYERNKEVFLHNCFLIVNGIIEREGHSVSMIVKKVESIWKAEARETEGLVIEPTQYFW